MSGKRERTRASRATRRKPRAKKAKSKARSKLSNVAWLKRLTTGSFYSWNDKLVVASDQGGDLLVMVMVEVDRVDPDLQQIREGSSADQLLARLTASPKSQLELTRAKFKRLLGRSLDEPVAVLSPELVVDVALLRRAAGKIADEAKKMTVAHLDLGEQRGDESRHVLRLSCPERGYVACLAGMIGDDAARPAMVVG